MGSNQTPTYKGAYCCVVGLISHSNSRLVLAIAALRMLRGRTCHNCNLSSHRGYSPHEGASSGWVTSFNFITKWDKMSSLLWVSRRWSLKWPIWNIQDCSHLVHTGYAAVWQAEIYCSWYDVHCTVHLAEKSFTKPNVHYFYLSPTMKVLPSGSCKDQYVRSWVCNSGGMTSIDDMSK